MFWELELCLKLLFKVGIGAKPSEGTSTRMVELFWEVVHSVNNEDYSNEQLVRFVYGHQKKYES